MLSDKVYRKLDVLLTFIRIYIMTERSATFAATYRKGDNGPWNPGSQRTLFDQA
jgi:hypothetical protein